MTASKADMATAAKSTKKSTKADSKADEAKAAKKAPAKGTAGKPAAKETTGKATAKPAAKSAAKSGAAKPAAKATGKTAKAATAKKPAGEGAAKTEAKATASKSAASKAPASKPSASKASGAKAKTSAKAPKPAPRAAEKAGTKSESKSGTKAEAAAPAKSGGAKAAAPEAAPAAANPKTEKAEAAPKVDKDKLEFAVNDFVVYPTHGVGKVTGIEEHAIAGESLTLFVISFERERMTLKVPVAKVKESGLRKLSNRKIIDSALKTLKGRSRVKRTMWSRRAQEYEAKINSGDPVSIAEVVRDLHRNADQPDQSYSERQMYQAALDRLARELAAVESVEHDTAVEKLEKLLKAA